MSRDPGVIEMLGLGQEDEYPLPIGGADPPQPVFCVSESPAIPPYPSFAAASSILAVTATNLTPAGGPTYYRGWYSGVSNNRVAAITLANRSAYPMAVWLQIRARMDITWHSVDRVASYWRSESQITVLEKNANDSANPTVGYAGAGPDLGVVQVAPTLQTDFIFDNATIAVHKGMDASSAGGRLPDLAPGRAYYAEPNHYIHEDPLPAPAAIHQGSYQFTRFFFAMWGWSIIT